MGCDASELIAAAEEDGAKRTGFEDALFLRLPNMMAHVGSSGLATSANPGLMRNYRIREKRRRGDVVEMEQEEERRERE